MSYVVSVEHERDGYQVTVRHVLERRLIGIPLRGVSLARATAAAEAINYAFAYGLEQGTAVAVDLLRKVSRTVETAPPLKEKP